MFYLINHVGGFAQNLVLDVKTELD